MLNYTKFYKLCQEKINFFLEQFRSPQFLFIFSIFCFLNFFIVKFVQFIVSYYKISLGLWFLVQSFLVLGISFLFLNTKWEIILKDSTGRFLNQKWLLQGYFYYLYFLDKVWLVLFWIIDPPKQTFFERLKKIWGVFILFCVFWILLLLNVYLLRDYPIFFCGFSLINSFYTYMDRLLFINKEFLEQIEDPDEFTLDFFLRWCTFPMLIGHFSKSQRQVLLKGLGRRYVVSHLKILGSKMKAGIIRFGELPSGNKSEWITSFWTGVGSIAMVWTGFQYYQIEQTEELRSTNLQLEGQNKEKDIVLKDKDFLLKDKDIELTKLQIEFEKLKQQNPETSLENQNLQIQNELKDKDFLLQEKKMITLPLENQNLQIQNELKDKDIELIKFQIEFEKLKQQNPETPLPLTSLEKTVAQIQFEVDKLIKKKN
jgi:hypothetical protein